MPRVAHTRIEVAKLLERGFTKPEIAKALNITIQSVGYHIKRIEDNRLDNRHAEAKKSA